MTSLKTSKCLAEGKTVEEYEMLSDLYTDAMFGQEFRNIRA